LEPFQELVDLLFDGPGCGLDAALRVNEADPGPAARAEDNGLRGDLSPDNPDRILAGGALNLTISVEELGLKRFGHLPIMPRVASRQCWPK
jgi:hypothetical protein